MCVCVCVCVCVCKDDQLESELWRDRGVSWSRLDNGSGRWPPTAWTRSFAVPPYISQSRLRSNGIRLQCQSLNRTLLGLLPWVLGPFCPLPRFAASWVPQPFARLAELLSLTSAEGNRHSHECFRGNRGAAPALQLRDVTGHKALFGGVLVRPGEGPCQGPDPDH